MSCWLPSTRQLHSTSCPTSTLRPRRAGRLVAHAAAIITLPKEISKVSPKGDLILCKSAEAEEKTTGGILLPAAAQKKPTSGDVVALGDGKVGGQTRDFQLQVGNTVLYNKFGLGVTDLDIQGTEHLLIKEDDCIGIMPRSGATADDIPELRPLGDRVLVKIQESADITAGGVVLPITAREKPVAGTVVRAGPGKRKEDAQERTPPRVKEGDKILYFKWAGDQMETPEGAKYVVLHETDILCRT